MDILQARKIEVLTFKDEDGDTHYLLPEGLVYFTEGDDDEPEIHSRVRTSQEQAFNFLKGKMSDLNETFFYHKADDGWYYFTYRTKRKQLYLQRTKNGFDIQYRDVLGDWCEDTSSEVEKIRGLFRMELFPKLEHVYLNAALEDWIEFDVTGFGGALRYPRHRVDKSNPNRIEYCIESDGFWKEYEDKDCTAYNIARLFYDARVKNSDRG